jgi:predicted nucleic acid-binding protein
VSVPKIVVHTDVFIEHLCGDRHPSVLRRAMGKFFCYATVFHAIELFSLAKTGKEAKAIEDSMAAMKVLGLNPKNARAYGEMMGLHRKRERWNILVAGLCLESRLPVLTDRKREFSSMTGLVIVSTKLVTSERSAEEILTIARQ